MVMEPYNPPVDPWLVILYQDEHIMVVNKPSGLLSVPGRLEEHKDSVMTRIQRDYPQAESVHRLDMATSGVIVVALNKAAEREPEASVPRARAEETVCRARLGPSGAGGRAGGFTADLRLVEPVKAEGVLRNRQGRANRV